MKHATLLFGLLTAMAVGWPLEAWAETVDGIEWTHAVSNDCATVTGADPAEGALTIPSSLGGYPVTAIGESAFEGCTGLASATIPDSVTNVGARAFSGCTALEALFVPVSWRDTEMLAEAAVPEGCEIVYGGPEGPVASKIGGITWTYGIADGRATVTGADPAEGALTISSSLGGYPVTAIGESAFEGYTGLASAAIPDSVTDIGAGAFSGCTGLESLTLPGSVTGIGAGAFSGCTGLESLHVPVSWLDTEMLAAAAVPEGCEIVYGGPEGPVASKIGGITWTYAVSNDCATVTGADPAEGALTIPSSLGGYPVTAIGESVFEGCTGLASAAIPDSVTDIGDGAFSSCTGLTDVAIGNGVTNIGSSAFYGCGGMEAFSVASGNPSYRSVGGLLLTRDGKILLCGVNGEVSIPAGVTDIGNSAFCGCRGLTGVSIPGSVTNIGERAFSGCSGLASATLSDSVAVIGAGAFSGCTGLETLFVPVSWRDTEMLAAAAVPGGCEIVYCGPEGPVVSKIGGITWTYDIAEGCATVTGAEPAEGDLTVRSSLGGYPVAEIGEMAFCECSNLTGVAIGNGVTGIGIAAFAYCTGLTNVTIPGSVTDIGDGAFSVCSGLTDMAIPGSVTNIGDGTFVYCTGLTNVNIGNGVPGIGPYAFSDCTGLSEVTIPGSVTNIGPGAFSGCTGLTNVNIGNGVSGIGEYAFSGCTGLTAVEIPDGVASIGEYAFSDCTGLAALAIPGSVTNIAPGVFSGCTGLAGLTVPDGVASIGADAFSGCTGLAALTVPGGVADIGGDAFSGSGLRELRMPGKWKSRYVDGLFWSSWAGVPEGCEIVYYGADAAVALSGLEQVYDGTAKTVGVATVPEGLAVRVTYDGSEAAPTNAGSHAVVATVEDDWWEGSASGTLVIEKGTQTIDFPEIGNQTATDTVELSAAAGSGLAVSYAVEGPAELVGTTLSFTGAGTVTVTASQAGDANWNAAEPVAVSFGVGKAEAVVTLSGLEQTYDGTAKTVGVATVPEGLAVRVTYDGSETAPTNAGSHAVVATVEDGWWEGSASGTLEIAKGTQSISFPAIGERVVTETVALSATATSGGAVAFEVVSGPGSIGGNVLSFTGEGTVEVRAVQEGNAQWLPVSATQSVRVVRDLTELSYMVVDLSEGDGEDARYPVSFLNAEPPGGWTDEYKTEKLVLRRIGAGTFAMGSPDGETGRESGEDRHETALTQSFYIGVFEVTQKQWESVMGSNPSACKGSMRPVERVGYDDIRGASAGADWPAGSDVDAASFLGRLRARAVADDGRFWDLPTEAQWEFACRAGTDTALNSGKDLTAAEECANMAEVGRYAGNRSDGKGGYAQHTAVGSYLPNAWGLYDMHGNVREWCLDWYAPDSGTNAVTDPRGPSTGTGRLDRGGGWLHGAGRCRAAHRGSGPASWTDQDTGFRLVRVLPPPRSSQTVSFPPVGAWTVADTVELSATATSGCAVAFEVVSGPGAIEGNVLSFTGTGTVEVRAVQAGNGQWFPASATQTVEVSKGLQTIDFPEIGNQTATNVLELAATASSGLAVAYAVEGPAELVGTTLSFTGAGTVAVTASQAGDANWNAAEPVAVSFRVGKAEAVVTLSELAQVYDGTAKTVGVATVPEGLAVRVAYDGSEAAPANAGSHAVVATVADDKWEGTASGTLVVSKGTQTIDFPEIGNQTATNVLELAATASSGLAVSYAVEGPAELVGTTLSFTGAGTVAVTASQAGDANWNAAEPVAVSFGVGKAEAVVALSGLAQVYDGTAKTVGVATVPEGLAVRVAYDGSEAAPANAGTHAVVATVADDKWEGTASGTLVVAKGTQAIDFPAIGDQTATNTVTLAATADSGLVVSYAVEGPAELDGTILSFTGAGSVTVTASQAGDGNWEPAEPVAVSFGVGEAEYRETVDGVEWTWTVSDGRATVTGADPAQGALTIPSSLGGYPVAAIGEGAFEDCTDLTAVTIPASVTNVGANAFAGCDNLAVLHVPMAWEGTDMLSDAGVLEGCTVEYGVQVAFDAAGGECATASRRYDFGGTYGWLPTATRTGYAFGGWWTEANGGGTRVTETGEVLPGVKTLYAKWTESAVPMPVHRFYSARNKGHFFTISEAEKNNLIATNPNWKYERVAYRAFTNQAAGTVPLYRFYSAKYKGHFYTTSESEKDNLIATNPNWKYERVAYYVYPSTVAGTVPVFRFWSQKYGHHFYTTSEAEKDNLIATNPNWKYERVAFHALPPAAAAAGRTAAGRTPPAPAGTSSGGTQRVFSVDDCGSFPLGAYAIDILPDEPTVEELGDREEAEELSSPLAVTFRVPEGGAAWQFWSAERGILAEDAVSSATIALELPDLGLWHWLRFFDEAGGSLSSTWLFPADAE